MCQLSPVPFHGDTIFCVTIENQPYTPAKPIVENMGLAWQAQAAKLSANKERWGVMMIVIPSESGEQQTLCLPVRKLPAFLASINPKKVRPELRPKIELYQAESDDALWNYWMNGRAERSAEPVENPDKLPTPDSPLTPDQQCTLQALVKARVESIPKAERPKGLYPQIWSRFNNHFRIARYCQLPQSRLSEAIEYLTRMDLAPALPASAPLPTPKQDNVPAWDEMPMPADLDKRRARICRELYELQEKFGMLVNDIRICLHPGGRLLRLPPELDNAYETLDALNRVATGGAYTARQAIYSAYQIGKGLKFV